MKTLETTSKTEFANFISDVITYLKTKESNSLYCNCSISSHGAVAENFTTQFSLFVGKKYFGATLKQNLSNSNKIIHLLHSEEIAEAEAIAFTEGFSELIDELFAETRRVSINLNSINKAIGEEATMMHGDKAFELTHIA